MVAIPNAFNGKPLIHSWVYCDQAGAALGVVGRYQIAEQKKETVPFFKRNGDKWAAGMDLKPRPLFGLEKLAACPKDKAVFVVEGEKCAAALHGLGIAAVSSLGGCQAAKQADWTPLNNYKQVFLLPDNDEPGEHYMQDVCRILAGLELPPMVKVLRLSELPRGGDVVDWVQGRVIGWDGYAPIPDDRHEGLKLELQSELKKVEAIPSSWTVAIKAPSYSDGFNWQEPGQIEPKTPKVQALTPELIPEPFRDWLADVSYRMQTPGDFAAVSVIIITSSLIGAAAGIRPKALDDWEVIPNLWGAAIGRPSVVLKTPSMKEPMQMIDRLQAAFGAIFDREKKKVILMNY